MGWDRKSRGPSTGYYYKSVRVPDKPYPIKVYYGRRGAGHMAAAAVAVRPRCRADEKARLEREVNATAEGDQLARELMSWGVALLAEWLVSTGHHYRRGEWRRRHA